MNAVAGTHDDRSAWGRGVLASYDDVTPTREVRQTDFKAISFSMQMVIVIVAAALSAAGSVWAMNSATRADTAGLRSDVRDILTRIQMQDEVSKSQRQLQDERLKTLSETVQDLKRRVELMQYEMQNQSKRSSPK